MADASKRDADRFRQRRWAFADCVFDEADWTLSVGGRRVPVETKPLELLRELLLRGGKLALKDDLLDAIWPDVVVVDASLPTAIRKLRLALGDDERTPPIIETVPRFGYRLAAPIVHLDPPGDAPDAVERRPADPRRRAGVGAAIWVGAAGALATAGLIAIPLATSAGLPAAAPIMTAVSQRDAMNAIRRLDVEAIERMLAGGWDPNREIEAEGNAALHTAAEICEWNPGHDQARLLLLVRTLFEGGGRYDQRNVWGDTPYSIAKAERYCGPDHPVTQSMRATCFQGTAPLGDRCLASYESARRPR